MAAAAGHIMLSGRFNSEKTKNYMVEVKKFFDAFGESTFMVDAVPGQSFAEQTMQGLTQAKAMVAFCTSDYGQKTGAMYETYQELQFAYEKQLFQ